jgi:hypothetical protein
MNLTIVENDNPEAKNLISLFILNKVIRLNSNLNLFLLRLVKHPDKLVKHPDKKFL